MTLHARIPLARLTAQRVVPLYEFMDSAHDALQFHDFRRQLGHEQEHCFIDGLPLNEEFKGF